MKIETVLNAYALCFHHVQGAFIPARRGRQVVKFRDWIIRHDERQKMEIYYLKQEKEILINTIDLLLSKAKND